MKETSNNQADHPPQEPSARPLLEENRNYTIVEAASATGVSPTTIWRALDTERLQCFRVGRRIIVAGHHLKTWLTAGGQTGWTKGGR